MDTSLKFRIGSVNFCCLVILAISNVGIAAEYSERALQAKERWAEMERRAVDEPFIGIRTSDGIRDDLFSIKSTNVSTQPVIAAAQSFLDAMTNAQKLHFQYSVTDPEWRCWSNVDNGIYVRRGVSLAQMSGEQQGLADNLLKQSLSEAGYELTRKIRKTDHSLAELNGFPVGLGEDLYYFTMMGAPSSTEPWGWQIDGHHLVINYFVLGDQVVMSPVFLGGEPAVSRSGKYEGNAILQQEQDAGLALVNALSPAQQQSAVLTREKRRSNNQAEAFKDNLVLDYEGVRVADFSREHKQQLLQLIGMFVGNLREGHSQIRMEEVSRHLDDTWFAWIGETRDDSVFYYRIHSPVILVEFDHQPPVGTRMINTPGRPTRDHIHVTIRTPNGNDYGKDLLRQHHLQHPH